MFFKGYCLNKQKFNEGLDPPTCKRFLLKIKMYSKMEN